MEDAQIRYFLQKAIDLSLEGVNGGHGGPFGCVIVKAGTVLAEGYNRVTSDRDPTAHAEIVAIREACRRLGDFQLEGCTLFCSCEPCPMCLGAIYWARPLAVYYAGTSEDAAGAGFDDAFIYEEIARPGVFRNIPFTHVAIEGAGRAFEVWKKQPEKRGY